MYIESAIASNLPVDVLKKVSELTVSLSTATTSSHRQDTLQRIFQLATHSHSDSEKDATEALRILDLSVCNLESVPESMGLLQRLKTLDISENRLHDLPNSVAKLKHLSKLSLASNKFAWIPHSLSGCIALTHLDLSNNGLECVPDHLRALSSIQSLNLSGNLLKEVPDVVTHLDKLEHLLLGDNALCHLPHNISKLGKTLKSLQLGGNHLEDLCDQVGDLTLLSCLNLNGNRLKRLPRALGKLANLKTLDLRSNELETLPHTLVNLDIQRLLLGGNPLLDTFVTTHMAAKTAPSLKAFAAKAIISENIHPPSYCLPNYLHRYLKSAKHCDNPDCKSVYFPESSRSQVVFADVCGAYRVPLMKYICATHCDAGKIAKNPRAKVDSNALKRVLLDNEC